MDWGSTVAFPGLACSFYPATLYLSTSKLAVAVVGNLAFATALLVHKLVIKASVLVWSPPVCMLKLLWYGMLVVTRDSPWLCSQVFLGSLRDIEQEMIRERMSSAIMESLLALTIFREEFSGVFVAMFATLVFVKVLHWLVQDRVDFLEVTPSASRLQHVRIVLFMTALLVSAGGRGQAGSKGMLAGVPATGMMRCGMSAPCSKLCQSGQRPSKGWMRLRGNCSITVLPSSLTMHACRRWTRPSCSTRWVQPSQAVSSQSCCCLRLST